MSLAGHVRTLGRGPGRSRSLTRAEAADAMRLMLSGEAAPEAIGALLMLLRMKGETPDEIAGFAQAAQAGAGALPQVDLDWPSYAAGRTRGAPWFLLSARLVAQAGHRVLIHGWNGNVTAVRDGLATAGIGIARDRAEAAALLDRDRIAYLPLETHHPALFALLDLRRLLGLRSCINTVCRMLNPAGAGAVVQGVFHPSYRVLQAEAAQRLGWRDLTIIKGGGGEFERHPGKEIAVHGLRAGAAWQEVAPPAMDATRRLAEAGGPEISALWQDAAQDPFAEQIVIGTAALALDTLGLSDAPARAADLWAGRHAARAA